MEIGKGRGGSAGKRTWAAIGSHKLLSAVLVSLAADDDAHS
jgi:hypothetical protein